MKFSIKVDGMSCMHCVKHVEECLSELNGVNSVEVSLENKNAIVDSSSELDENTVKTALDEYGYILAGFEKI
ncbi:heavy-metal-associated domain-containing protein [Clostridium ihumii]|uniref:heavy-metal-associated domain-containing protein n=1 Tax=Clostridium ihumii TaxID=1470356 RepID=UPI00058ED549|nr:heavy metal-associated domain-containing protein [Clostridium ihumii]